MSATMRAAVTDGLGAVEVVDRPVPRPGAGEVLIAVGASGVCGTDLHVIDGSFTVGRYPVVPGHEFAGTIAGLGPGVAGPAEGTLVGVDPNLGCGSCRWCRAGIKTLCPRLAPLGIVHDGAAAEYVVAPAELVVPLPDGLDAETGALIEPLSCVLHAADRVAGWRDARVLVTGAGPIGLIAATVAKHLGAGHVAVVEPHAGRRERATEFGADAAYADAGELEIGEGIDIAVEASGHPAAVAGALGLLGTRGTLLQMGVAAPEARVAFAPLDLFAKELTIIGSMSLADAYRPAAELMADLAPVLAPLVTDRLSLDDYGEALRRLRSPDSLKVQVIPASARALSRATSG